ncbi:hypothetical protein Acf1_00008 [Acidovorax phage ACF1]|nr:hypothetical protein Acf1_00008 [Acidovorax phage ACF1]
MTVAEAYARDDSPDRTFWTYSTPRAESGLDPWHLLDGLDASVSGDHYLLDWANGRSTTAQPQAAVYMQRTAAERTA